MVVISTGAAPWLDKGAVGVIARSNTILLHRWKVVHSLGTYSTLTRKIHRAVGQGGRGQWNPGMLQLPWTPNNTNINIMNCTTYVSAIRRCQRNYWSTVVSEYRQRWFCKTRPYIIHWHYLFVWSNVWRLQQVALFSSSKKAVWRYWCPTDG